MEGKLFVFLLILGCSYAQEQASKKQFSIFNVVSFDNIECDGSGDKNGTCYTKQECDDRDGVAMGECAEGYGVCCVVNLGCGARSAENVTYLEMSSTNNPPINCEHTVCKCKTDVCRMRLDFESFTLSAPNTNTATTLDAGSVGDCATDRFVVGTDLGSTPVICGANTGQHIFVDVGASCIRPSFSFGRDTTTQRRYTIKVTQFKCNDELGGPEGCLQYFTATTGEVASFNFPLTGTTVAASQQHLSGQNYDMCFRRADGNCRLCFTPTITAGPNSFGLSLAGGANVNGGVVDTACSTDYLAIPQVQAFGAAAPAKSSVIANAPSRICGRTFGLTADTITATLCTTKTPFRISFYTDSDETLTAAAGAQNTNEANANPSGLLGFRLSYFQDKVC